MAGTVLLPCFLRFDLLPHRHAKIYGTLCCHNYLALIQAWGVRRKQIMVDINE